jgi:hypothetical protein
MLPFLALGGAIIDRTLKHKEGTMAKILPVGVAQKKVLEALDAPAAIDSWDGAKAFFDELGIVVGARRVGRSSEPQIWINPNRDAGGGWNAGGDGDSWGASHTLTKEQIALLRARGWWHER